MSPKEPGKASKYIVQLYDARCNHQWASIPELARKVDKHASNRRCLTDAARASALLHSRPGREGAQQAEQQYGLALSDSIRSEDSNHNDVLDGATTRAIMYYWTTGADVALTQVPEPLHRVKPPSKGQGEEAWSSVSVIQGTLIRGLSFEAQSNQTGATTTYRSIISYLSHLPTLPQICPALRQSAEELLCHVCLYFANGTKERPASLGEAMAAFHVLSSLLRSQKGQFTMIRGKHTGDTPRDLWRAHYRTLSQLVRQGLVYHPSPMHRDHDSLEHKGLLEDEDFRRARQAQCTELKRVEANYEKILLRETTFPKANETNQEVREWIELIMSNWKKLCGPSWTDMELGEGGKLAVGRNTLDILYRAQTKSFHSTQILRHLFTIHSFLTEFDLAFRTFDTYIEITTKGKARMEKSGSAGLDLDDDDTVVRFAAEAVRVACRWGPESAAQKALEIGNMMHRWLDQGDPDSPVVSKHARQASKISATTVSFKSSFTNLKADTLVIAYRAVGISQAQWSRCTFDPELRKTFQKTASQNLQLSLKRSANDAQCTETLYALAVLLAEMEKITEAGAIAKRAIKAPDEVATLQSPDSLSSDDERQLQIDQIALSESKILPLRHLVGLLESSKEEFELALKTCDASLRRFSLSSTTETASLQRLMPEPSRYGDLQNLLANLDSYDRQNLVEMKMSQVELTATIIGPGKAINASNELILLFSRLFGPIQQSNLQHPATAASSIPPQSSRGTVRSSWRKTFHRKSSALPIDPSRSGLPSANTSALPSRPQTMATAPSIQVTGENGKATAPGPPPLSTESDEKSAEAENSPSGKNSIRRLGAGSLRGKNSSREHKRQPIANVQSTPTKTTDGTVDEKVSTPVHQADGTRPLDPIAHNMPHTKAQQPVGHADQPPKQDSRLPAPPPDADHLASPTPHFVEIQRRRHSTTLLIKVWLLIGRLYTSAARFADATDAVAEAHALAQSLELAVAQGNSSAASFQEQGWGGGKSVDALWGDVHAARGALLHAQSKPHDAAACFERALACDINHAGAIVGLSKILLDIYARAIPSQKPGPAAQNLAPTSTPNLAASLPPSTQPARPEQPKQHAPSDEDGSPSLAHDAAKIPHPLELYRLAARDRACGLLSSLVRRGNGYADAEAWLVLARGCEESGQVEEAREALWRVVELEDCRPVRGWADVGPGGYVL